MTVPATLASRLLRLGPVSLASAAVLAACSPAPEEDPAGEAQETPGGYGIDQQATDANQAISGAGILARNLASPTIGNNRGEMVDRLDAYLDENEGDLPEGLAQAARADLQSIRDAMEAGDEDAAMAGGQALVETLRAQAPEGGTISAS